MLFFRKMFSIAVISLAALAAQADPIEDLSFNEYRAGWYPNFIQQYGPMSCQRTCKIWVGSEREHEISNDLDSETKRTSVCKVPRDRSIILKPKKDPSSHWLYGNQFDDKRYCIFTNSEGKVRRSKYFMCECVEPSGCEKADLVVSKIHNPIWDHSAQRSYVKVDIQNIGSSASGASFARMTDTGTLAWDVAATPGVAAGSTVTVVFSFSYWVYDPNAELSVEADYKSDVDECEESNNTLDFFGLG